MSIYLTSFYYLQVKGLFNLHFNKQMNVLVFCAHTKVKQYNIFIIVCRFTLHGARAGNTRTHIHPHKHRHTHTHKHRHTLTLLRSWLKLRLSSRQTRSYGKVHPKVHLQCQSKEQQADRHTLTHSHSHTHTRTHTA